ncbi:MAG: hypothetical protein KDB70_04655 [Mycobacterium sp.]|nr:hypothetical protein [Mycobacterium sp.]
MNKAAGAIADCGYDTFGAGNYRRDGSDLSSVAVALYTAHKDSPVTGGGGGTPIDKTHQINPEIGEGLNKELNKKTISYSLKAQGLPLASINISYLGDDNKVVTENNITVTAGYTWDKTVTATDASWLKVSTNSAGLAGLGLDCSVNVDSAVKKLNDTDSSRSGTMKFAGAITPAPAQTCG